MSVNPPAQSKQPTILKHQSAGLTHQLRGALNALVHQLGLRTTPDKISEAIRQLCDWRLLSVTELAEILGRGNTHLLRNHLGPMIREGVLAYAIPGRPNHPQQKYRAVKPRKVTA